MLDTWQDVPFAELCLNMVRIAEQAGYMPRRWAFTPDVAPVLARQTEVSVDDLPRLHLFGFSIGIAADALNVDYWDYLASLYLGDVLCLRAFWEDGFVQLRYVDLVSGW